MKASTVSIFSNSMAAMNDIPCTFMKRNTSIQTDQKQISEMISRIPTVYKAKFKEANKYNIEVNYYT